MAYDAFVSFTCIYVIKTIQNVFVGLGTDNCPHNNIIAVGIIEIVSFDI